MYEYTATCFNVVDGDTVDLQVDLGFHMTAKLRFRLLGINTPEMHAPDPAVRAKAVEARDHVASAILRATPLVIRTEKADSFGRWLVTIFHNGVDKPSLNDELLAQGLAAVFKP